MKGAFSGLAVCTRWLEVDDFDEGERAEDIVKDEGAKEYDCYHGINDNRTSAIRENC